MRNIIETILFLCLLVILAMFSSYYQEMTVNKWIIIPLKIIEFCSLFLLVSIPFSYLSKYGLKTEEAKSIVSAILLFPIISLSTSLMGSYKPDRKDIPKEVVEYNIKQEEKREQLQLRNMEKRKREIDNQYKGKYTFKELHELRHLMSSFSSIEWPVIGVPGMVSNNIERHNFFIFNEKENCEFFAASKFTCIYVD